MMGPFARFAREFTHVVLEASGEASVNAFAVKHELPKATLNRWAHGERRPRNRRRDPLLLRVLEICGITGDQRVAVLDRLFAGEEDGDGRPPRGGVASSPGSPQSVVAIIEDAVQGKVSTKAAAQAVTAILRCTHVALLAGALLVARPGTARAASLPGLDSNQDVRRRNARPKSLGRRVA